MNKYIDAEKLIAELERRKDFYHERGCGCDNAIEAELDDLLVFIAPLQQEQPHISSGLDEAAEAHRRKVFHGDPDYSQLLRETFKAGAKWMAEQEQPDLPSGEDVMTTCNQILIDWVKEGKTPDEVESRKEAHSRFFELYDEYMMPDQPEVEFEKEYTRYMASRKDDLSGNAVTVNMKDMARHFCMVGKDMMREKAIEWFEKNWRKYIIGPDADGCIGLAFWKKAFRKDMED